LRERILRRRQIARLDERHDPKRAPQEWKGSLERRSSSPVPVIEEMFSLT